jgi:predicted metalloprotease
VKNTFTYYDEASKTGSTMERIYFFVDPVIVNEEGVVCRLEKCGTKEERELVERPYSLHSDPPQKMQLNFFIHIINSEFC